MGRSYGVDEEIDMSELDDELAAIDEQLSLEAEVQHCPLSRMPQVTKCTVDGLIADGPCSLEAPCACRGFDVQMGESEVPSYLVPEDTAEPASVVPAQPAATGEQVDEFGLPIAPTPAAAT